MFYLRYLCLFAYSFVKHILCCVFALIVFVLCKLVVNAYFVVFFVLLVFVLCFVYGGVNQKLCCVFCFVFLTRVSYVWWSRTHNCVLFYFVGLRRCVPKCCQFLWIFYS